MKTHVSSCANRTTNQLSLWPISLWNSSMQRNSAQWGNTAVKLIWIIFGYRGNPKSADFPALPHSGSSPFLSNNLDSVKCLWVLSCWTVISLTQSGVTLLPNLTVTTSSYYYLVLVGCHPCLWPCTCVAMMPSWLLCPLERAEQ